MRASTYALGCLIAIAPLPWLACGDDDAPADGGTGVQDGGSGSGPGHDLGPLSPCLVSGASAELSVASVDKVDLLFMVDDSGSMAEEQASLRAQFPKLIRVLTTGDREGDGNNDFPPVKSLHLGVVSSDLGLVGIAGIDRCAGLGDDGVMNEVPSPDLQGCQAAYPRFLTYTTGDDDPTTGATDLACLATLGTRGCGFEQQLESALKALWPADDARVTFLPDPQGFGATGQGDAVMGGAPGMNAGFLRSDPIEGLSLIAVVIVTDEEDCSSKDTRHLRPASFLDPNDALDAQLLMQGLNVRCNFNPQNLYTKERYINGFKALRPGNEQLVVFGAIVGVPSETTQVIPDDFGVNPAARDAFYAGIRNHALMQPMVDTLGTPSPDDDSMRASCDTPLGKAYPPNRIVDVAEGFGANGIVQSICQEDLAPAIDAIIARITPQLGAPCLPRPLVRNAEGKVDCNVIWELPLPGRAPPGTPTACGDQPFLLPVDEGAESRSAEGGARCRVAQLAVMNRDGVPAILPTEIDGTLFSDGFYYDDFSEDTLRACPALPKQRIAFTAGALPPTGVTVKLECLSQVGTGWEPPAGASANVPQPAPGDPCREVMRNGALLSGDAACAIRLANGEVDQRLFCHPDTQLCTPSCSDDADCPPAWVCDHDGPLAASGGPAQCVAQCGGGAAAADDSHVGDACFPQTVPPDGFDPREGYLGTSSSDCGGGVCLVYQLAGDPLCPPAQSTEDHRCSDPNEVPARVYCSCRCDAPEGFPSCECPSGFSCVDVLAQGPAELRGGYCVRDGTFAR